MKASVVDEEQIFRDTYKVGKASFPTLDTTHRLEFKNVLGAVAGYFNGQILISCGRFGVALRLPSETLDELLSEKGVKHLKYLSKGHIKKEYAVLPRRMIEDEQHLRILLDWSLEYTLSLRPR